MADHVIDRSPEQVRKWIEKTRIELLGYGFSVVRSEWLHQVLDKMDKEHGYEKAQVE